MAFASSSNSKKRKVADEGRTFKEKWTENYFFIEQNSTAVCLICIDTVACFKEYNLKRHYDTRHAATHNKFVGQDRQEEINKLKKKLTGQQMLFRKVKSDSDMILRASYVVCHKIAKKSKPFTDGEFVKDCIKGVVDVICPEKGKEVDKLSLSRWTVARRIDEMSDDIVNSLKEDGSKFNFFSIAVDESTDVTDTAQLAIFIRGVNSDFVITEELLSVQSMKDTTTGQDIYEEVKSAFSRFSLKWENLSGIVTDGAPAMKGKNSGLVARIKTELANRQINPDDVTVFHCIIHQENLCVKVLQFKDVMSTVVSCINFIKARGLNHRQFRQFLEDMDADQEDLLYFTEVRWLSRGKMLKRFFELKDEVSNFMDTRGKPVPELQDPKWLTDFAFLVDITAHLNELNTKLQKREQVIHELYSHIKSFQNKLRLAYSATQWQCMPLPKRSPSSR
ncbi:General transcription factor II-I repeat domain-containing protein 2 [Holothuria leucospilota]|uniref:General transcription factor II-I repeat domain-containing protein 2 n=1 Tax=Holothuria leucospilota TaxID=206669 RepID=A0A9Q0YDT9_HOLLE|nr:General transcription factor II-I repeat domain-containing protein 2 [Holothuria leucospilota]